MRGCVAAGVTRAADVCGTALVDARVGATYVDDASVGITKAPAEPESEALGSFARLSPTAASAHAPTAATDTAAPRIRRNDIPSV